MQLAGRLRKTTLGDLLGNLYRARAHGVLELTESEGRAHRIHLAEGRVLALETAAKGSPLGVLLYRLGLLDLAGQRRLALLIARAPGRLAGELLLEERLISPEDLDAVLRQQLRDRLDRLFSLCDARVSFHVARQRPRSASFVPLSIAEYLHGRPRARDRKGSPERPSAPPPSPSRTSRRGLAPEAPPDPKRARALRTLGLPPQASREEVRRAFRALARDAHPDRFPHASLYEQKEIALRFARMTEAYHFVMR